MKATVNESATCSNHHPQPATTGWLDRALGLADDRYMLMSGSMHKVSRSSLFGLVAPSLGWAPPLRYLLRRARILRLLEQVPVGDAVEFGCGAGALLDDFFSRGFNIVGVETSPRALALARLLAVHSGGTQSIFDEFNPSWRAEKDLVCAFDVLEHIEDDDAAITQWVSLLRPGGLLMLSVPAHRKRWSAGDQWAGHWRRYDKKDLIDLLHRHNLSIVHLECYGFPLGNLTERIGTKLYQRLLDERTANITRQEATAQSGVERTDALRLFQRLDTFLGRLALRFFLGFQAITSKTNLGCGYLVLARRR